LNLDQWLCPSPNQTLTLQGKYSSSIFKYIKISASACTGLDCHDSSTITSYLQNNDYFTMNYYYVSMSVNLQNPHPITYHI
jgi:hypothetical protein